MSNEEKKNPFKEYAEHNSVEGLHKVLSAKSIIRGLAWLVVLLVCIAAAGYALRNNFIKIANPPTSTTISTTTLTTLDFPAVTVCNLNIFSAALARTFSFSEAIIADLRTVFDGNNQRCYSVLEQYYGLETADFTDLIKISPNDLISRCRFGGEECNITTDFVPTLTHLGICFTFNNGTLPIRKVNNAGVRNGLQLELKVNEDDYIATFGGDAGIKIAVHPQSEPPLPDELGIAVPPGNNAFISFKKRTVEDETGINCRKAQDTDDWNFLSETYDYSQAACLTDSFYTRVADNCRCIVTDIFVPRPSKPPYSVQPVCSFSHICCNFEQYTTPIKTPCLPSCSFEEYPVATASYSLFPAGYKAQSDSHLSTQDSASANIFFQTLTVENQRTEYAYGFEEFFAEMGGHLELFIGANLIGLFEFFFFLFDVIIFCVVCKPCRKSPRRRRVELTEFNDNY